MATSHKQKEAGAPWDATDWRAYYEERAGILQYDGGLPRREAESRALEATVAEWLHQHRVRSAPGCCLGCGKLEHTHDPLLPFATEGSGHAWLHARCWQAWHAVRKAEVAAALVGMGITTSGVNQ